MTTANDIIAKGHTAMAELATRPRKPPQTGEEAMLIIEEMRRRTKSKAARIKMADMAISIGNLTPRARSIWILYRAEEASK
jgi:hypothetical protein